MANLGKSILRRLTGRPKWPERAARIRAPRELGIADYAIAYNDFGGYCVPLAAAHRPAVRAIMEGRVWERATLEFMAAHAGDGDIVHAGTFFGDFLPHLARSLSTGAKLWAFEPNSANHRCASITVQINGLANVELTRAGLGAAAGEAEMATHDGDGRPLGGASRLGGPRGAFNELVPIVTVDATVPADRPVSIVQLDVEGFEGEALAGALATIGRSKPLLILETVPEDAPAFDAVRKMGYEAAERLDENVVFRARG